MPTTRLCGVAGPKGLRAALQTPLKERSPELLSIKGGHSTPGAPGREALPWIPHKAGVISKGRTHKLDPHKRGVNLESRVYKGENRQSE